MRAIVTAVILAMLAGCASPSQNIDAQPFSFKKMKTIPILLTKKQRNDITEGVKEKLKDPYSARFSEILAVTDNLPFWEKYGSSAWVCGKVNAKNSYGGYTGDRLFWGNLSKDVFRVGQMGSGPIEQETIAEMCSSYGIYFAP